MRRQTDGLANAARQPANCQEVVDLGNVAHQGDFWPILVKEGSRRLASNLCSGVKCHLGPCARGLANSTQYEGFWERVLPELHTLSFIFWDAAGLGEACRREVWKARSGQTWNVGKAFLFGMLYNGMQVLHNACPLCGEEDSITHILSACKHHLMVALYILRHDQAGRKILRAIHAGSRGSAETHADIGAADKLDSLEIGSKRVPASVLSDSDLPGGPGQRTKLRPDILLIEDTTPGTQSGSAREEPAPKRTRRQASEWWVVHSKEQQQSVTRGKKVTVVEVGYCADTKYHAKLEEKQGQHAQLLETEIRDPHHPQAMYLVEWEESWESGDVVHEHADSTPLFEPYMQARTGAAILACSDSGQSRAQRQGHPPVEARPATGLTTSPQLAALIDIDPLRTCNPDTDTLATGKTIISSNPDSSTCVVHLPCRSAGGLPLARLDLLHTAYLAHGVQGLDFEEALAQLLMRKRPKATGKSPSWRLPAALVSALQRGLGLGDRAVCQLPDL